MTTWRVVFSLKPNTLLNPAMGITHHSVAMLKSILELPPVHDAIVPVKLSISITLVGFEVSYNCNATLNLCICFRPARWMSPFPTVCRPSNSHRMTSRLRVSFSPLRFATRFRSHLCRYIGQSSECPTRCAGLTENLPNKTSHQSWVLLPVHAWVHSRKNLWRSIRGERQYLLDPPKAGCNRNARTIIWAIKIRIVCH